MQVLPNRNVHMRDTVRGALNLRAEPHDAVSQRCRHCGFMAFRARERCPVCGESGWPFNPLRERTDGAPAGHVPHAGQPAPTWSSRVAATVRRAAFKRPRASSAPLLSILTLVLLVGGYVTFDRMCRTDAVCRGQGSSGATTIDASVQAADAPTLQVMPAPVYATHPDDGTQVAATPPHGSGTGRHAATTLARNAPDGAHAGAIRVADWNGGTRPARHTHAIRRVSAHTRHGRRAAATEAEMAMLYRGH
ncbi:ATP-dependent serine protease [Burkholderia anthina]|uniref:ATP-dependent serine protease n=1 Tax=Burkholderia anthina TaxID=179879 RepID=UPI00158BABFB|nr:ATP-dependent serine protease [Burkholderia anthina]